jgi:hypothetical protein
VESDKLRCLDCPNEGNEIEATVEEVKSTDENDTVKTVSVKVNGKEILNDTKGKKSKLTIDSNGIIIKTE